MVIGYRFLIAIDDAEFQYFSSTTDVSVGLCSGDQSESCEFYAFEHCT